MLDLKDNEKKLLREIENYLDTQNLDEYKLVKQRFGSLKKLGEVISDFPSIREMQILRGMIRDEQKLLSALCSFAETSHLLHIPSRVVLAKSYLVAKFQAFALLTILVKDREDFLVPLRRVMYTLIHTLMIEEVYFSCLDDPSFTQEIKTRVADDLITLWDSGTDPRLVRHLPAMEALWNARDENPPSFGTMDGSSELLRITIDLGDDWQEFLVDHAAMGECRWALEEFIFGLSYEEIQTVRSRLIRFGVTAVNHDEIRSYLGSHPTYGIASGLDLRAIYNFYIDRRDAAQFRKRIDAPGPWRSLEEIYLKYRIARE